MAILAQCPICKNRQSLKNKVCKCGQDMDAAKRSKRVKYWITYRLPGGKQRTEHVGYSIEEARNAEGKRRGQKRENRIFDMLPESKMTFDELVDWYLNVKSVKKLASYNRVKIALNNFQNSFGKYQINAIKTIDLENYQLEREEAGRSPATIDMEITIAKTMVNKAFDNDMLDGRSLKAFRGLKRKLRKGSNARKRMLKFYEYAQLIKAAPPHLKPVLIVAFNTGMRHGEIRTLKWSYIDRKTGFINLPEETTKEKRDKAIPINHHVKDVFDNVPRALKHDFVFMYRGEPIIEIGGYKKSFKTTCKNVGVPQGRKTKNGIIFHDIRRTVKTNMLHAGVDKVYRDMILGHSLQGMDVHYLVSEEDALKEAMGKYTKWLDAHLDSTNVYQNVYQSLKGIRMDNVTY